MKTLNFTIGPSGDVKTAGSTGFGEACVLATRDLEAKLGTVNEGSRELVEDFYNREQVQTVQQTAS